MFVHFSRVSRVGQYMRNVLCSCDTMVHVLNCRSEDTLGFKKYPKLQTTNCRSLMNYSQNWLCMKVSLSACNSENYDSESHIKSKVLKVKSLRVDIVLKATLQMTRNKIESAFYENKIRVNGRKVEKKSAQVAEGDEVDVALGPGGLNPAFVQVARVEILEVEEVDDGFTVKFRKMKTLAEDQAHDRR